MIILFTDYSLHGPYIGQVEAILYQESPREKVINLFADLPRYNPKPSAYLLAACANNFPSDAIFFSVVDPGVGSFSDKPIVLKVDDRWYVGPDNGIFDLLVRRSEHCECWKINWRPEKLSSSFHGRDLYAPVCAMIANGIDIPGEKIQWQDRHQWPDELNEVIYIDAFGNCMTGLKASGLDKSAVMQVSGNTVNHARTFSTVTDGNPFWYENSNGLVEIAVNKGSAADNLGLIVGSVVSMQC